MSDVVLGIGGYTADSAAAIVVNGQLIAAVEEERFTRKKHQGGMPYKSIEFCLKKAGVTRDDVSDIGFCYRPDLRYLKRIPYHLGQMFSHPAHSLARISREIFAVESFKRQLANLKGRQTRVHYIEHHLGHAASAFYVSSFEDAAILTYDERGEWTAGLIAHGRGSNIQVLKRSEWPQSLGMFYSAFTKFLGFEPNNDEYKVMGLASYGKPTQVQKVKQVLRQEQGGAFSLDLSYFTYPWAYGAVREKYITEKFIQLFGRPRLKGEEISEYHIDLAASAQAVLEDVVLAQAEEAKRLTGAKNLVISGGVALNCTANGKIMDAGLFDDMFIPPCTHDGGLCLGNAYYVRHQIQGKPRDFVLKTARLGPSFTDAEIEAALKAAKADYTRHDDIEAKTADLLAAGRIVAWFQEGSEFGPRALGSRSILAEPTNPEMKEIINRWVKHREDFRPFAPSCALDELKTYFDFRYNDSPFMLFICKVKEAWRAKLPAITHTDGTARVQTVTSAENPRYYQLMMEFKKRKGVACVLNTSFNVMGEPIVNTPEEAIRCFFGTGLDDLVMGSFLVSKRWSDKR